MLLFDYLLHLSIDATVPPSLTAGTTANRIQMDKCGLVKPMYSYNCRTARNHDVTELMVEEASNETRTRTLGQQSQY